MRSCIDSLREVVISKASYWEVSCQRGRLSLPSATSVNFPRSNFPILVLHTLPMCYVIVASTNSVFTDACGIFILDALFSIT